MPIYFFDVVNGDPPQRDDMGTRLRDQTEAEIEAACVALELAKDRCAERDFDLQIEIRDEERVLLSRISLSLRSEKPDQTT
jgi:hypothetical protein